MAEPGDEIPKGEWWKVFEDPALDVLEESAVSNNQSLQAAVARVDRARAVSGLDRSRFFPDLTFNPSYQRERTSGNLPTPIPIDVPAADLNVYRAPIDLSYEVDLWGRVRRSFEAAQAEAQATVADYRNVLLALTADVAVHYFLIRSQDIEIDAMQRTLQLREETVRVLEARSAAGVLAESEAEAAMADAAVARAELADKKRERAEAFHALALLCGRSAGSLEMDPNELSTRAIVVPPGMPSALLERRPDIASAERRLAAANARIGAAKAAYFPAIRLTGQAGYLSAEAQSLFSSDSRIWSFGPAVSLPLFNAGRTAAQVREAKASYQEALADYRQTILAAFKDVEDALAQVVLWNEQAAAQLEALLSLERVVEQSKARYRAGNGSYLDLLESKRRLLQLQRQKARAESQRRIAVVRLVKALGGGWDAQREF